MAATPLHVSIHGGRHSLFDYVSDPRLAVRRFDETGGEPADILVLPAAQDPLKPEFWPGLPDRIWQAAAEGRTRLVLDASVEGYLHHAVFSEALHRLLASRAVRPGDVAYVTQDRLYEADYEAWRRGAGVPPMRVFVYDYYIQRLALDLPADGAAVYEARLRSFEAAGTSRPKAFLSLNYTPRATKLVFLLDLIDRGLWDDGLISFGGFESPEDGSDLTAGLVKRMHRLPGFRKLVGRLEPHLDELKAKGRITFGLDGDPRTRTKQTYRADALAEYAQSWFSVVTETEMESRLNRLTEKSFKPLVNFHPMLVLGNPGTLALVRQYGFQTFGGLFDERYDEEPDARRRFDLVFAELERLCRQDRQRLPQMIAAVSETLKFNARHGLVELPRRFREELGPGLVTALLDGWRTEA